ncbi:hypothetical protein [Actinoplanes teichomyceticus]|uniref:Uncharacterized protein n=1 Tax=Actinoplanes teichomyceticus TaxID=1867 RepID=A0A561W9H9_ACTTI|nr:hypothetical protein [Actinoplanes teichomyceticus]TWG20514.1 hypothetical protein FHX34_10342 [Actinoplanes teichomyceticus]GIF15846.1 hypothetical protein Ate01nite_58780 [Actinoplanes teichomyceticus]
MADPDRPGSPLTGGAAPMTSPPVASADAELARLETAVQAITRNLVELDEHPTRKDLDSRSLTGRTASEWADASAALGTLWDGYRMLTESITRARLLRGQRRLGDADRARYVHEVLGPSIVLSTSSVPLAQRGLLGAGQVTATCSPAELLAAMERAFATAVDVVTRAGEAWRMLLPAAAEAAAGLRELRTSGAPGPLGDQADRLLGELTAALATDPLGAEPAVLDRVGDLIRRAQAERDSAAELRASLTRRLAQARERADELDRAGRAAAEAHARVSGRFPEARIATVRRLNLRPDLAAIEALATAGQWALISPRLARWSREAAERLAALQAVTVHNDRLLAERNELRGRLDAYQAKALRHGLGEHPALIPLAERARAGLYTAPCELEQARAAVNAYQEALTATITRDARP